MSVPCCPICGSTAQDVHPGKDIGGHLAGEQSVFVCHCAQSHRFLVRSKEAESVVQHTNYSRGREAGQGSGKRMEGFAKGM